MGFTLRFHLGVIVIILLLCSTFPQTRSTGTIKQLNDQIPPDGTSNHNKNDNKTRLNQIHNEEQTKTEPSNSNTETKLKNLSNNSNKKEGKVIGESSVLKLQKVDIIDNITKSRENVARSINIDKYLSKEFHNKNNVYTIPSSSDTEKYVNENFDYSTVQQHHHNLPEEHDNSYNNFHLELTTPKSLIFDNRYKEAVHSVDQTLEHIDDSNPETSNEEPAESLGHQDPVTIEDLFTKTKNNDTNSTLDYINYKNIVQNVTNVKNDLHKDLVVEEGANLNYQSNYNQTKIIDEKEPTENIIPSPLNVLNDTSTRKLILKPTNHKNNSHASILSNKIESETMKSVIDSTAENSITHPIIVSSDGATKMIEHVEVDKATTLQQTERTIFDENTSTIKGKFREQTNAITSTTTTTTRTTTMGPQTNSSQDSIEAVKTTESSTTIEWQTEESTTFAMSNEKSIDSTPKTPESVTTIRQQTDSIITESAEKTTIAPSTIKIEKTTAKLIEGESTTQRLSTKMTRTTEQHLQDNQIVPVHSSPSTATALPLFTTTIDGTTITEPVPVEITTLDFTTTTTTDHFTNSITTFNPITQPTSTGSKLINNTHSTTKSAIDNTTENTTDSITESTTTETSDSTTNENTAQSTTTEKILITTDFPDILTTETETAATSPGTRTSKSFTPTQSDTTESSSNTTETSETTITTERMEHTTIDVRNNEIVKEPVATTPEESTIIPTSTQRVDTKILDNNNNNITRDIDIDTNNNNASTAEPEEVTNQPEENSGTIAAIIISSIGAVCLILLAGLLFIMRKRQKRFNYGQRCTPVSLDDYSMDNISVYNSVRRKGAIRSSKRSYGNPAFDDPVSVTHPLNFSALGKFANNIEEIKSEFEEIPQITAKTNELPEGCDTKNRYANVIPLPETRVFLNAIDGYPNSDYINANYVTGPKNIKAYYIACQAPLPNTVDDFWRMIWEQQCKVILMITHLFENGVEKCVDYLPPSEVLDCHRLFGDFQVTLKKREVKDKYIISILQLKNMVSNSWREVTHFWYLGWPEKGVPTEANSVIAFLIEARSYMKSSSIDRKEVINGDLSNGKAASNEFNPVVVHCSPGTGRTGVVIACDIAIREFEQARLVDIPKIVYKIRRDRASSVQTKEQYAFIYKVINLYATKLTGGALDSL